MKRIRTVRKTVLTVLICLVLALSAGAVYEHIERLAMDGKLLQGTFAEVNGHKIHTYEAGKGSTTVLFIAGFGTPSPTADFEPLYKEISRRTKTIVYERPGDGWSEMTGEPRTVDIMAAEMHEALTKTGSAPPYILVAHSAGSLEALRFAQLYKNEVAGIVTIDCGSPEFYSDYVGSRMIGILGVAAGICKETGIARLVIDGMGLYNSANRNYLQYLSDEAKALNKEMSIRTLLNKNFREEYKRISENAKTVCANGRLGMVPLRILTADASEKREKNWGKTQVEFRQWSADSKQMTVKDTDHYIHQYRPDIVNEMINELLDRQQNN